jgi:hypothetical protein
VKLTNRLVGVGTYALPPKQHQPGSGQAPDAAAPQGHCINDTTTLLFNGQTGCWRLLFGGQPAHNEVVSTPDSNDTRMQQVTYANGKLWGALDTALTVGPGNTNRAGVAWYVLKPGGSTPRPRSPSPATSAPREWTSPTRPSERPRAGAA